MSNIPTTLPPPPESDPHLRRVKLLTLENSRKLNSLLRALDVSEREYATLETLANSVDARVNDWLEEHYGRATPSIESHWPRAERDERPTERVSACAPTWPPPCHEVEHA